MKSPSQGKNTCSFRRIATLAWCSTVSVGLSIALLLGTATTVGAIPPNAPDPGGYVANGPVNAIARAGGRTYIGGDFTQVGKRSGAGVVLSPSGSTQTFPEVAGGDVHAVVADGNGGWYLGGDFTAVGGEPRVGLAHVKSDGSLDPDFKPGVTDLHGNPATVDALALSTAAPDAGTLYVGGEFSKIGVGQGEAHANLAALKPAGGKPGGQPDLNFNPKPTCAPQPSCSPAVRSLAIAHVSLPTAPSGKQPQSIVFAGGAFTEIGDIDPQPPVDGLAAVWGLGSVDATNASNAGGVLATWAPDNTLSSSVDDKNTDQPTVLTIQVPPAPSTPATEDPVLPVYIGGSSPDTSNGPVFPFAYAYQLTIHADRTVPQAARYGNWKALPGGCTACSVRAMALDSSSSPPTLYFGGDFTAVGSAKTPAAHLAKIAGISNPKLTNTSATPSQLGAGVGGSVRALVRSATGPTKLFAGGDFSEHLLALDTPSGAPSPTWAPVSPDAAVDALATDAATPSIYAGGELRSVGSAARGGLAAFDSSGALLDWAPNLAAHTPGASAKVHALAASDTTVYAGGRFPGDAGPGGSDHANLAAIDAASGNPIEGFKPKPSLATGKTDVFSLALLGSTLYVGGAFDHVDGSTRTSLAAVDATSGHASGWSPVIPDGEVHAVLPACGAVYAGGTFTQAGGQAREYLAALDPASGAATSWDPAAGGVVGGAVLTLARYGSTIYAGGNFATIGGALRQKAAGLNVADATATAFDPSADGPVRALAVSDSVAYLGGIFAKVGDAYRLKVAAVDPASGQPTGWDAGIDPLDSRNVGVNALAVGDDALYMGGEFSGLGTTPQSNFASFSPGAGAPFATSSCESPPPSSTAPPAPPSGPSPQVASRVTTTGTGARDATVDSLAVSPTRVRMGGVPLTVRFVLSRSVRIQLRFDRRVPARCAARRSVRVALRCYRYVRFANLAGRGIAGANRLTFPGQRVGRRRLVPGRYRVSVAVIPARASVAPRVAAFTVVAR